MDVNALRHSCSHILASAVKKLYPKAKLGIGPAIENGFYYDFDIPGGISEEDLPKIEKLMREEVKAKIRYGHCKSEAIVEDMGRNRVRVKFLKPQLAITPGQAAVFYRGDEVIGGGWIEKIQS